MLAPLIGIALAALLAPNPSPADRAGVTVDQLRNLVAASHATDAETAQKIRALHLSERLTAVTLQKIVDSQHPGPQTAEALRLLADFSAFLEPPPQEIPERQAPGIPEQQAMVNGAVHFLSVVLKQLPDFFAVRTTESFDNAPTAVTHSGWSPVGEMHPVGTFSHEITFRGGKEVVGTSSGSPPGSGQDSGPPGLTSTGEFGTLLAIVLRDTAHGTVNWSHWEQTADGVVGVFRYEVPQVQSHYAVDFCCVKSYEDPGAYLPGGTPNAYHGRPAYHGEMSIDPVTGTLVRLTLQTELKGSDPITDAGVGIDYGPVVIQGDKSYICPVRTLAISTAESLVDGDYGSRPITRINEVAFTHYHRFRASVQIVPAGSQ